LLFVHLVAANYLKTPELELTELEAKKISDALERVDQRVKLVTNPKTKALYDLGKVLTQVYGSRVMAIYLRKKAEAAKPINRAPQPIRTAPVMHAAPSQPQRPAPPEGVDTSINDPLAHAVTNGKTNGSTVPVVNDDDTPLAPFNFDPTNIKVVN
jgi:hypothetical protein